MTTLRCESCAPLPLPKRVSIHSAPVMALERRSQLERYTIMKTWLKTGHTQGIQMLFIP